MRTVCCQCATPVKRGIAFGRQTSARSTKCAVNPAWLENVYLNASYTASEHQGPVQIVRLPGKGRGIVAASDLEPGQLVLISRPLAYVTCCMGAIPSPEDLATVIKESKYGPEELGILNNLFSGVHFGEDEDDGGSELDDIKLYGIIGCNSFGEEFTDFPTSQARSSSVTATTTTATTTGSGSGHGVGQDCNNDPSASTDGRGGRGAAAATAAGGSGVQVGHLGLFPSFSLLNHSCLPNAVNFVVGGRMLVMAARRIRQGSEVLINYLGRASLRPVDERQAQLAEGYHFSCDCPRCRTELMYGCTDASTADGSGSPEGAVSEVLQDMLARCDERNSILDELGRTMAAAAAAAGCGGAETAAALDALHSSVQRDITQWEELVRRTDLPAAAAEGTEAETEAQQQWLRASAFDLYGQYAVLAEATKRQRAALAAVQQQVEICEAVAPASDLHMYLQVKLALLTQPPAPQQQQKETTAAAVSVAAEMKAMANAAAEGEDEGGGEEHGGGEEWQRCIGVLRRRYGNGLSDVTLAMLLRGAVYGLSQVAL